MSLPGYPCTKTSYPNEWDAERALSKIWAWGWKAGPGKLPIRAYKCEKCPAWHMTSQPITNREKVSQ